MRHLHDHILGTENWDMYAQMMNFFSPFVNTTIKTFDDDSDIKVKNLSEQKKTKMTHEIRFQQNKNCCKDIDINENYKAQKVAIYT